MDVIGATMAKPKKTAMDLQAPRGGSLFRMASPTRWQLLMAPDSQVLDIALDMLLTTSASEEGDELTNGEEGVS